MTVIFPIPPDVYSVIASALMKEPWFPFVDGHRVGELPKQIEIRKKFSRTVYVLRPAEMERTA